MTFWEDANLTMAPLTQSLSRRACFLDQGRGGHREGAPPARHGGWGAHATRCSLRYNSRDPRGPIVYTNAPKRRGEAILADLCTLLRSHACPQRRHGTTVYTNAPKRLRGARSSHLCTLLRSQGHPQPKPTVQQCTQTPQNGAERPDPPICVHYCDPKATHNPSPRPTAQQCTQTPQNGPERPFPPICVHSCIVALAVRPTSPGQ